MLRLLVPEMFIRYYRVFSRYLGARIVGVVVLTLLMSYAESIGIALFFPLFSRGAATSSDKLGRIFSAVFAFLHVPLSPAGALPLIALLFLLKGALTFATVSFQGSLTTRLALRMRRTLLDALSRADYQFITRGSAGQHANLLVTEVGRSASGFSYFVRAIPSGISAVVFFFVVLALDWKLTVVGVAMGLITFGILRVSGAVGRRYSEWTSREHSKLTSLLIQMLHAFKYLRATSTFDRLERRADESAARLAHAEHRSNLAAAAAQSLMQPVTVVFLSGLLYYRTALRGEDPASLFVVLAYFFRIMTEMFLLQTLWQSFCGFMGSINAVEEAVGSMGRHQEGRGSRPFHAIADAISCTDVSFAYHENQPVLRGVSLRIPKQSTVAFVGESGCGKSTLVDLLMGTLPPASGQVAIDGADLRDLDIEAFRAHVGYVTQESVIFDDTVANNVCLWGEPDDVRIRDAARRAKCAEFIQAMPLGYASPVGDRGVKLSGGQRQRLAIARELYKNPEVLVLDEATSALDSESERAIQESIDALKGQMTILLIAHRLSTIRGCDRIFVLHEGRVVEEGSYDELSTRPGGRFRRMCELQSLSDDGTSIAE